LVGFQHLLALLWLQLLLFWFWARPVAKIHIGFLSKTVEFMLVDYRIVNETGPFLHSMFADIEFVSANGQAELDIRAVLCRGNGMSTSLSRSTRVVFRK